MRCSITLAMLYNAKSLLNRGLPAPRPYVQLVLGVRNALPARRQIFDFLLSELRALLPDATWKAAVIGRAEPEVVHWCIAEGGHVRTELEDNLRLGARRPATSGAELVRQAADLAEAAGRRPATPAEAPQILGLAPA